MAMKVADVLINAGFAGLVALFLSGGPVHQGDQAHRGLRLLFSQWYPYLALFLALLAARRLLDRGTFARIGAIRWSRRRVVCVGRATSVIMRIDTDAVEWYCSFEEGQRWTLHRTTSRRHRRPVDSGSPVTHPAQ